MYPPQPHAEQLIHQDANVLVTTARFVVNGTVYPIRGLTAMQYIEVPADYTDAAKVLLGGIALGLLGAIFGGGLTLAAVGAGGGLAVAVLAALSAKPRYVVRVMTAAGQADVFTSPDKARAGAIATALNRAVAGG
jgi:hypothetical protein